MIRISAYNPSYIGSEPLSDEERRRLAAAAPTGRSMEFVAWAEQVLVDWQLVQDLLNPDGGDFEVVNREPAAHASLSFYFRNKNQEEVT